MKNSILMVLSLNMLFLASCDAGILKPPTLKVVVEAKNEEGEPVKMVNVVMAGSSSTPASARREASGFTDANGHYTATIATMDGNVKVRSFFTKGYYKCGNEITVGQKSPNDLSMLTTGKWDKDEKIVPLLMRPIKNPVPMYVKDVRIIMKSDYDSIGYDLEIGEPTPPHGSGQHADIVFSKNIRWESYKNYEGEVRLSIPDLGAGVTAFDISHGFQHCQFKSPYEAPKEGYQTDWKWQFNRKTEGNAPSTIYAENYEDRMFIFRVRAELDHNGQVIRAKYGKIYAPFNTIPTKNGVVVIEFTYYLNPDYTRNLEFDSKRNLFSQNLRTDPEYKP